MYEKAFQLEIITPSRVVYRDQATSLSAPGVQGGFQVLYNHAPLLAAIEIGELKVKDKDGNDSLYATSGGFVEVNNNKVVVLADSVERATEIDVERAKRAKQRAEERLQAQNHSIDQARAEASLMRAMNRLRLAGKVG